MDWEFLLGASMIYNFGKINCVLGNFRLYERTKTFSSQGMNNLIRKFTPAKKYVRFLSLEEQNEFLNRQEQYFAKEKKKSIYIRKKGLIVLQKMISECSNILPSRLGVTAISFIAKKKKTNNALKIIRNDLQEEKPFSHEEVLKYVRNMNCYLPGEYLYSITKKDPILYASIYAAMIHSLFDTINCISHEEKQLWIEYLNSFQCGDGLYRDLILQNEIAEVEDWWGWRHLSAHVITALTTLGAKTKHPFHFLDIFNKSGEAYQWIANLPWKDKPDFVSNKVMNYCVLLQYNRDFHTIYEAGTALDEIFDYLNKNLNSQTGLWGNSPINTPQKLSRAVQTSYHLWNLYFYDKRPIKYIEKAIDSLLDSQNPLGGFGIHPNSSACDDIDAIDPLCRFYFMVDYRRKDIEKSLEKALRWIMVNQMRDGGFVFKRFEQCAYGHDQMTTGMDESNMFATWFRTLSIAYVSQVLNTERSSSTVFNWVKCPGYQFWHKEQPA